jgi:hypothetical protein
METGKSITNFLLMVIYRTKVLQADGETTELSRMSKVDLVNGDVGAFLASLPPDIDDRSVLMAAVVRSDGMAVGFSDGKAAPSDDTQEWIRLSDTGRGADDAARNQAIAFAKTTISQGHEQIPIIGFLPHHEKLRS